MWFNLLPNLTYCLITPFYVLLSCFSVIRVQSLINK